MNRQRIALLAAAGVICVLVISGLGLSVSRSGRAEEAPPLLRYPTFPPTPTVAPPPSDPLDTVGTPLFTDSFGSEGALTNWQIVDLQPGLPEDRSVWVVKDGQLVQNRTAAAGNPNEQETLAVTGKGVWTDYRVSAKVYDQNNATFGLVVRRQGNSFYRYRIIASQYEATPKQVLEKVIDGVATPLATLDGPGYEQRTWHVVSMQVIGTQITVTLDGEIVAQATDATLRSGQAGLYTRAFGGIRFDDVAITTP